MYSFVKFYFFNQFLINKQIIFFGRKLIQTCLGTMGFFIYIVVVVLTGGESIVGPTQWEIEF